MLQRIQSLYLAISAICLALMMRFPFASFGDEAVYHAYGVENNTDKAYSLFLNFQPYIAIAALVFFTFIIIFLFKNRKLQMILCRLSYVLVLGLIVVLYLNIDKLHETFQSTTLYEVGLYLPVGALAFNFLANRGINRDEKLVKSLDRLR